MRRLISLTRSAEPLGFALFAASLVVFVSIAANAAPASSTPQNKVSKRASDEIPRVLPAKKVNANSRAATESLPSKKPESSKKKATASAVPEGVPTKLPAFKGAKKIKVNFDSEQSDAQAVVVRSSPLDSAMARARSDVQVVGKEARSSVSGSSLSTPSAVSPSIQASPSNSSPTFPSKPVTAESASRPSSPVTRELERAKPVVPLAPPVARVTELEPEKPLKTATVEALNLEAELLEVSTDPAETSIATGVAPVGGTSLRAQPSLSKIETDSSFEQPETTFSFRASYLDARYDKLSPELQNGASALGFKLARTLSSRSTELLLAVDIAHGRDQAVELENTRMTLIRGGASWFPTQWSSIRPFLRGTIGLANVNVRSFRFVNGTDFVIREHLRGTGAAVSPSLGARLDLSSSIHLEASGEYLTLLGSEPLSRVGGWLLGTSVGFGF